ncbi:MAG TPA: hypothetical protein VMJ75_05115 [Candidatus Acidoferrales bacterium]|nr:hypothetical protein [Candidatus Acidoferrales bacterium]
MNRYCRIVAAALFLLPLWAAAQVRPAAGGRADQTTKVINDCEKRTNSFKRKVRLKSRGDAPNLQRDADNLEEAMNKVGDSWNKDHDLQKTRAFVTAAIASSQTLNRFMVSYRGDPGLSNDWAAVRTELNALARQFGLPAIRW